MNLQNLCLKIAKVEDGKEVIEILKTYGLWDCEENWVPVGSKPGEEFHENNHATIGNQQSNPANAIVEKLVNCGDSALLLKAQEHGIEPKDDNAPGNVREAIGNFFNLSAGKWIHATPSEKTRFGEKYCNLVATGEYGRNSKPTFSVIDSAEGQHPHNFQKTFLSLHQKNKVDVTFVQGKFGMGSYGAVNFCTVDGLQLIISKRNPALLDLHEKNLWGFTIVRKIPPEGNYKSSRWVYLVVNGEIPSFEKDDIGLFPGKYPNPYGQKFEYGSFVKLYNYDIGGSLRTNITLDLYNKINTLLVNPVVPIRFHERRPFRANSYESTLDGLETRLERDRSGFVAKGFPSDFIFHVKQQRFKCTIFAFNKFADVEKKTLVSTENYGNGVMFINNGQTNGQLPPRFFSTRGLKYENISKNLLILVDCSELEPVFVEKLFKNNREDIFDNEFTREIKETIRLELKDHEGLKLFQHDWRANEIRSLGENENTKSLLQKLFNQNPELTKLLVPGAQINNPFNFGDVEEVNYNHNFFPTFFELTNPHPRSKPRPIEKDANARVRFSTDAPNDYFTRAKDPGIFKVFFNGEEVKDITLSGFNGKWNLGLPAREEDLQKYSLIVDDVSKVLPIKNEFYLKLIEKKEHSLQKPKTPRSSDSLALPEIKEVQRAQFENFGLDEEDLLKVNEFDDGFEFYANMDNIYLLNDLKGRKDSELDLAKEQYKLSLGLIGLVLIAAYRNAEKNDEHEKELGEYVQDYTRTLSPVLMTLVRDISKITL